MSEPKVGIKYEPKEIETKWTSRWEEMQTYATPQGGDGPKSYVLGMFPYPSGEGLHTGHVRIYTAVDVMARYQRMKGISVLMPMGWDSFGLPAENAAIKARKNPVDMVPHNEANFKRQMMMLGLSYDWQRSLSTIDPAYYKWTQRLFLKLYSIKNEKGQRLVYRKEVPINWCPFCKTGLANEEVQADGTHERCGTKVTQRLLPQWNMRITDYADRLLSDLDSFEWEENGKKRMGLDWPEGILAQQRNWIGKKEGVEVLFGVKIPGVAEIKSLPIFTTRIDTIYGVTFVTVSPELANEWMARGWAPPEEVGKYVKVSLAKSNEERMVGEGEKTGVETGLTAINPLTNEGVSIYVADYVMSNVGTGAVMGVPGHDDRDKEFADKFGLTFKYVISPEDNVLIDSGKFSGMKSEEAKEKILEYLLEKGVGKRSSTYHLRDWIFSRQRYWGEPFPLVYCAKCGDENGVVPLPDDQLPLTLPYLQSYEPTETGLSPLSRVKEWVETTCPNCGGPARRETDTMPNWAGSCWYFLRFADPHNDKEAWSEKAMADWLPVDWYLGGAEHAVLHLLYARFWTKAFFDLGLVKFTEPFLRLRSVGMVLAADGKKMSKSLGNVVNPDDVVAQYGADAVRIYEMFMGPWDQAIAWNPRSLSGCRRFCVRLWERAQKDLTDNWKESDVKLAAGVNRLIVKTAKDIEALKFNTIVSAAMKFVNEWEVSRTGLSKNDLKRLVLTMAPLVPFLTEELWHQLGEAGSVHLAEWPKARTVREATALVIVQVNGKTRGTMRMESEKARVEAEVEKTVLADEKIGGWIKGNKYKIVFVPGRLINFVV